MKKSNFMVKVPVIVDPTRKGAKFSLDGEHFFNAGELAETLDKIAHGLPYEKSEAAHWEEADIPELEADVKSWKANIRVAGANNMDETLERFFKNAIAKKFHFVDYELPTVTEYSMNANEFEKFIRKFCNWEAGRKQIRFPTMSGTMRTKMQAWFRFLT